MITENPEYQKRLSEFYAHTDAMDAIKAAFGTTSAVDFLSVPDHLRKGMALYYYFGVQPGSFLTAALQNDGWRMVLKADQTDHLIPVVRFICNNLPSHAVGSEHALKGWMNEGGAVGREIAREAEQCRA